MSVILPNGRNSFDDLSGNPLVGGRLWTYQPGPGVTTPKLTYFDNANTAAHTNPIILDARGEATIFWNGGYNVRLEDALGGLIYTVESINADPNAASLDATLRADLADTTLPTKGAGMVGYSVDVAYPLVTVGGKLNEIVSVRDKGAKGDGVTNDLAAMLAAKTFSNRIHFPRIRDQSTTYYIGAFSAGAFDGCTFSADAGVTLSFAANAPYSLYKNIIFASDIAVFLRDISIATTFLKTPDPTVKQSLWPSPATRRRNRLALDCTKPTVVQGKENIWPGSDAFPILAPTTTTRSMSFAAGALGFRGPFVELGAWETVSAFFDGGMSPGPIGVLIRGTLGFTAIYSAGAGVAYNQGYKMIGGANTAAAGISWAALGQGRFTSYEPDKSIWSVTKVDKDKVVVKLNGKALTAPYAFPVGDILEVGFVCYTTLAFTVSNLTIERRTDAMLSMPPLSELCVYGDSTAERWPGSWDQYLRPLLDDLYGIKVDTITNNAVNGETMAQQYTRMLATGFGGAFYVFVCAGTNEVQGGVTLAAFITTVTNVITLIQGQGRRPIFVIPWMWYSQALGGGHGQNTNNYDLGAPYRLALERLCYENGCVVVRPGEELPLPDPSLLTSQPKAPLLRDNIHQDQLANQLYARMLARALADDYLSISDCIEEATIALPVGSSLFQNGCTPFTDFRIIYDRNGNAGFSGTLNVTTIAHGTVIMRIPRHVAPFRALNVPAVAGTAGGATILGSCWLNFDPTAGTVTLNRAPATTAIVILSPVMWKSTISFS